MITPISSFEYSLTDAGDCSRDPDGRPDPRWRNAAPPRMRANLQLEFEPSDWPTLRDALTLLGYRDLPA